MLRLSTLFKGFAKCNLGDGRTVTFWEDLWSEQIIAQHFLNLFAFARNTSTSVKEVMAAKDLESIFLLLVSQQSFEELEDLRDLLVLQNFDE